MVIVANPDNAGAHRGWTHPRQDSQVPDAVSPEIWGLPYLPHPKNELSRPVGERLKGRT